MRVRAQLTHGCSSFLSQLEGWRPVAVHATSWVADPRFGGAYTYPRAGAPADVTEQLAAPLVPAAGSMPLVCFAGEATSDSCIGTVGGAMLSGMREARRLLDAWGVDTAAEADGRSVSDLDLLLGAVERGAQPVN
jgi:monoamine oxidase